MLVAVDKITVVALNYAWRRVEAPMKFIIAASASFFQNESIGGITDPNGGHLHRFRFRREFWVLSEFLVREESEMGKREALDLILG